MTAMFFKPNNLHEQRYFQTDQPYLNDFAWLISLVKMSKKTILAEFFGQQKAIPSPSINNLNAELFYAQPCFFSQASGYHLMG